LTTAAGLHRPRLQDETDLYREKYESLERACVMKPCVMKQLPHHAHKKNWGSLKTRLPQK
jgi:hypothetical protein